MTDLAAWLLAQIADDEAAWQMVAARDVVQTLRGEPIAPRMLAECAAKRRIVQRYAIVVALDRPDDPATARLLTTYESVVLDLAQPYADRPGFDPAWKVGT